MNYYKRHIGDYAKDTSWLTTYQHGVYALLLDWYYASQKPIPVNLTYRIVRARSGPERQAVDEVVAAFFDVTKSPGFAHSKRADLDIAKYQTKSEANSLIAQERESTKRARSVVDSCGSGEPSHKPLATSHKEAKAIARQAARFDEFWSAYPVKKGRKEAEAKWKARGLDAIADQIIADVQRRLTGDRQWLDGFIPHGSTYVAGARWEDAIEAPRQSQSAAPTPRLKEL